MWMMTMRHQMHVDSSKDDEYSNVDEINMEGF